MSKTGNELDRLLDVICREWGFCLAPEKRQLIATERDMTDHDFALKVLEAEGFPAPEHQTEWLARLSAKFRDHLGRSTLAVKL
jgi:hypothetical protein